MDPAAARILAAVHAIPAGQVASYGAIALRAGLPRRARLVARVIAHDADPALPWHRVVRADGRIAFPVASEHFREQRRRLEREGVRVHDGRVASPVGTDDLDATLWGPSR